MSDPLSIMELRALYVDEADALSLLREQNALPAEMKCPGKNLIPCGAAMKQRRKKPGNLRLGDVEDEIVVKK